MSILIVDDSKSNLVVLKRLAMREWDGPIIVESDAREALGHLSDHHCTIIICDYEMPHLNGVDFTRRVRRLKAHSDTPIIMVTSHTEQDVRAEALKAGCTEFLNKPLDPSEFKLRIRNLIRLRTADRRAS